ncbi:MAG: hypothetical protein AB1Z98_18940, partial [Nannocystaceae bacterium]
DPAVRAGELFGDGQFAEAAAAFEEAYALTGDPAYLFGRAQALRRAGNCGAAIEVFEAFIDSGPPEADVRAANDVIEACRSILDEPGVPSDREPEPMVEPTADPAPAPARAPPRWPRDVAGGVLLGTGAAVTVAGGVLYGVARARTSARGETEQEYEDRSQQVRTLGALGISALVVGGSLLVGSVIRYALVARAEGEGRSLATRRFRSPLRWRF